MQCGAVAGSSHEPELEIVPGLGHGYRGSNPAYLNHLHVASLVSRQFKKSLLFPFCPLLSA